MGQPHNGIVESYTMVIATSQALADPFDLLRSHNSVLNAGQPWATKFVWLDPFIWKMTF